MLKRFIFVLFFIILLPGFIYCDGLINVSLEKREIFEGENTKLTVEIASSIQDAESFVLPAIDDFLVLSKENYLKDDKYIYEYVITPKTAGFFTIPQITVYDYEKKNYVSKKIEIKVLKTKAPQTVYTKSDYNTFVKAGTDGDSVFVNQQIYYTFEFATRYDLAANPSYVLPMFKDFWKTKPEVKSGYELIDGENYFTFSVKIKLYPMREGKIVIDPSVVEIKYANGNTHHFKTEPVKISVFPLPQKTVPENFTGAVGKYYIASSINKKNVKVNEPVNLTISVKGNGNINSITEPVFELSDDIKKYATFVKINSNDVMSSKNFQCVLIPLMSGQKNIPEITFSYFDTDLKNYVIIKTDPIIFDVNSEVYDKNAEHNDVAVDTAAVNQTVLPLKEIVGAREYGNIIANMLFWTIIVLAFLFAFSAFAYRIIIDFMHRDKIKMEKIAAYKKSIAYLKHSYECLQIQEQNDFYNSLDLALKTFLQSKTNSKYVKMSKDEIKTDLSKFEISGEMIIEILKIVTECELFKFKPLKAGTAEMQNIYDKTKYIIEEIKIL